MYGILHSMTAILGKMQKKVRKIHINFKKALDKIHKSLYNEGIMCRKMHKKEEVLHVH